MKEHQDDVLLSVKESSPSVDSTTANESGTERGKIEGVVLGEKDEGEDMMVDVVGANVIVDDHGDTRVDLDGGVGLNGSIEGGSEREPEPRDQFMEDSAVVEDVCDALVGSKDVTLEKVEVVVSEEGVKGSGSDCEAKKPGNGAVMGDSKLDSELSTKVPDRDLTKEIVEHPTESVQEVVDGDHLLYKKTGKEIDVINFSEIPESFTETANSGSSNGHVVAGGEGLVYKEKSEDGVKNQSLSNEVVDAGTSEDKDQQARVDQTSTESLQPTTEVTENDVQMSGNATMVSKTTSESLSGEPQPVEGEIVVREEESKRGLTEETVERPIESVQEASDVDIVMNEKTGKVDVLNSPKSLESVTKVHGVSKDSSLECPDNPTLSSEVVDAGTDVGSVHKINGDLDQKAAIGQMSKEESSHSTIEIRKDDSPKSGNGTAVGDYKMDDELTSKNPQFVEVKDKDVETERGLTEEIMQQPLSSVQDAAEGDRKTAKDDEPSTMVSLGSEEVVVVIVEEGLEEKDEAQDGVSLEPSLVCPDDQSLSTEVVNVSTGEMKGTETSVEYLDEVKNATTHADFADHGVLPAGSEFSYEEARMDRGEDAGMDIDEVLGWKDETPEIGSLKVETQSGNPEEQKVETTNISREQTDFCRNQETEGLDDVTDDVTETLENETTLSLQQSCYFHPPESEGEFSVSDLVWGKVKSHPWWPGQIYDPSDASEKALKYHKKDSFLVAYFGDRTFAWNDSTVLKPFRAKFSQIEKLSSLEAFNNAVHSALEEVSRRVELGLTCSCISQDFYEKIKCQVVENAGIREESSRRHGIDKSTGVSSFEPDELVDYVRLLAKFPYGEVDKMELTITKAQLSSYACYKGYRQLPEFQLRGNLLEDGLQIPDKNDGAEEIVSSPGVKKRKALDSIPEGSEKRPSLHTETVTPIAKPSFKVGELIQRVATQLTGPPSDSDKNVEPVDQPAGVDMLSQLHLAAQDPMKGHVFLNSIIPFFHSHRAAVLHKSRQNSSTGSPIDARKRKPSNENDPEEFEFDDVNDSYWTDRIIQNYPEEQQPSQDNQSGGGENQIVPYEQDKPVKPSRRSNKKRFFSSNHEIEAKEQSELIERRRQNLATEVLMKFAEGIHFPSEIHLNKMFRRFGPLMESETEVNRQNGRARVVFKKCSDAEVAHSSAGKFNIFGSISVNYELNYTPLISYKPLPLPMAHD